MGSFGTQTAGAYRHRHFHHHPHAYPLTDSHCNPHPGSIAHTNPNPAALCHPHTRSFTDYKEFVYDDYHTCAKRLAGFGHPLSNPLPHGRMKWSRDNSNTTATLLLTTTSQSAK
jgi:hypothetical protein